MTEGEVDPAGWGQPGALAFPLTVLIVDLLVVALIVGAAWGYWRGVGVGALALFGLACGAVLGSRLARLLLEGGRDSTYAPFLALTGALLLGGILAAVFERVGRRVRGRLAHLSAAGGVAGALLGACLGLVAVWLLGAGPGQVRSPSEDPAPQVAQPNPSVARDPDVAAAGRKVVQMLALDCGASFAGTGWIASRGVVATNAHVVSGRSRLKVRTHGKRQWHDAIPIWFDPKNDIALLRVPGLKDVAPLPIVEAPKAGTSGALLGFPYGRWSVDPVRLGRTSTRTRGSVNPAPGVPGRPLRGLQITTFTGLGRHGNSGGPIVDAGGRVLATYFAGRDDLVRGVANVTVTSALRRAGPGVSTGPGRC